MAELEEILEHVALANRMLYEMDLADSSTIERGHVSIPFGIKCYANDPNQWEK